MIFIPQPFSGIFLFRLFDWPVVQTDTQFVDWIGQCSNVSPDVMAGLIRIRVGFKNVLKAAGKLSMV